MSLDSADGDLSVLFKTQQPDALLLLAKSINGDVSMILYKYIRQQNVVGENCVT
jgi:hypothetical protein